MRRWGTHARARMVIAAVLATATINAGVAATEALADTSRPASASAPVRLANADTTATHRVGATVTSRLAPRRSTFTWQGGRWRMRSQANFNPTD